MSGGKSFKTYSKTDLLYKSDDGWNSVPSWANFYQDLGKRTQDFSQKENCTVIALAIPTRSFAAAFCGLGVIKNYLFSRDETTQLEYLSKLEKGTPLYYRESEQVGYEVTFKGIEEKSGLKFIRINRAKQRGRVNIILPLDILIPENKAYVLSSTTDEQVQPTTVKVGRKVVLQTDFLLKYFKDKKLNNTANPSIECAFVGLQTNLRRETTELEFGSASDPGIVKGVLNEILSIRSFSGEGSVYRSEVYRPLPTSKLPKLSNSPVVIFDGSNGYLSCKSSFKSKCQIVLLEKTETNFIDAVSAVNVDIVKSRNKLNLDSIKNSIPSGVEISAFEVRL